MSSRQLTYRNLLPLPPKHRGDRWVTTSTRVTMSTRLFTQIRVLKFQAWQLLTKCLSSEPSSRPVDVCISNDIWLVHIQMLRKFTWKYRYERITGKNTEKETQHGELTGLDTEIFLKPMQENKTLKLVCKLDLVSPPCPPVLPLLIQLTVDWKYFSTYLCVCMYAWEHECAPHVRRSP